MPTLLKYNSPAVARTHVDHCIEALRAALTCNADLTPYLWYKYPDEGDGPAKEDFQATHKCKRFDSIVDWMRENSVDVPVAAVRGQSHHNTKETMRNSVKHFLIPALCHNINPTVSSY